MFEGWNESISDMEVVLHLAERVVGEATPEDQAALLRYKAAVANLRRNFVEIQTDGPNWMREIGDLIANAERG